jgi:hypothetical protein
LEENIGSTGLDLSADDLAEIEDAASKIEILGARYPRARQTGL